MPKRRQPRVVWQATRRRIWLRDGGVCQYPRSPHPVTLDSCHIDHLVSGKRGSNADSNLRVLCRYHHVLRADHRHRGLVAQALADDLIPPHWRELVWDDAP